MHPWNYFGRWNPLFHKGACVVALMNDMKKTLANHFSAKEVQYEALGIQILSLSLSLSSKEVGVKR